MDTATTAAPQAEATKKPERKPIVHCNTTRPSSQVKTFGYDAASRTLGLTFTRGPGNEYQYPFPPEKFADLEAADAGEESLGTFFGKHIKPLPFEKFGPLPAGALA